MKKLINTIATLLSLFIAVTLFQSCRKGPEDPFMSLRTRNSRITGTWTLKSLDYTYTEKGTTSTSNDVNNATYSGNTDKNYKASYNGSTLTVTKTDNSTGVDNSSYYVPFPTPAKWQTKSVNTDDKKTETWVKNYTMTLSIYDDDTYKYTVTQKATSYTRSESKTTTTTTTSTSTTTTKNDTSLTGSYNSSSSQYYSSTDETKTYYGTWSWVDDGRASEEKIIISAGPLSGFLVRLSNSDIKLDHTYSSNSNFIADDPTYNWIMTKDDVTNVSETNKKDLDNYSNSATWEIKSGIETKKKSTTINVSSGISNWEKTDTNRSRK